VRPLLRRRRSLDAIRHADVPFILVTDTSQDATAPNDADKVFGQRARLFREAAGLSQRLVAEQMTAAGYGWHQSTCAKTEAGDRVASVGEATALALILGVHLPVLLAEQLGGDYELYRTQRDAAERDERRLTAAEREAEERLAAIRSELADARARLEAARQKMRPPSPPSGKGTQG
jgi:transcriptional regulator with XRE-family HTH domain